MKIDATVTKTAGAGICINTVNPTDSPQTIARFQNVCANNQYCGIQILNAAYWVIDACVITNANTYGIYSDCTQNFDAGDNTITGGTLISGGATGVGIYLINNCRVNNAKILGHDTGILVQPSAAAGTRVDFQLGPALSIENQQNFGIRVSVNAASVGVANSHINGVQTGGIVNNNAVGIQIEGPAAGFNIQNNICVLGATGQRGIVLVNNGIGSASAIIISNNLVTGGDATSVGIIGDGSNGLITDNLLLNLGTPLTIASSGGGVTVRNQTLTFAQLPTTIANGSIVYCSNGTAANPVASGGTGCLAKRLNGVWVGN